MANSNSAAPRYDHVLNAGSQYELRADIYIDGVAVDLTGYEATFKARAEFDSGTVLFDLLSSDSPSLITLGADGAFSVDIPASTTAGYITGVYKYTVNVWPIGNTDNVSRALEGEIEVRPQVSTA